MSPAARVAGEDTPQKLSRGLKRALVLVLTFVCVCVSCLFTLVFVFAASGGLSGGYSYRSETSVLSTILALFFLATPCMVSTLVAVAAKDRLALMISIVTIVLISSAVLVAIALS